MSVDEPTATSSPATRSAATDWHDSSIVEVTPVGCLPPLHINGPVRWMNAEISVSEMTLPDGEQGFLVVDEKAGVTIMCDGIEVAENVKLW
jgi:hypothetical protein